MLLLLLLLLLLRPRLRLLPWQCHTHDAAANAAGLLVEVEAHRSRQEVAVAAPELAEQLEGEVAVGHRARLQQRRDRSHHVGPDGQVLHPRKENVRVLHLDPGCQRAQRELDELVLAAAQGQQDHAQQGRQRVVEALEPRWQRQAELEDHVLEAGARNAGVVP